MARYEIKEVYRCRWLVEASALSGAAVCVAAAALALAPRLLDRALPPHSFAQRYSGAFRYQAPIPRYVKTLRSN